MEDHSEFLGYIRKKIKRSGANTTKFIKKKKKIRFMKLFKVIYCILSILLILIISFILLKIIKKRYNFINYEEYNNLDDYEEDNDKLSNSVKEKPQKLFLYKEDKRDIKDKQKIRISMSLDNNLVYPTLVSMTSACANNDERQNILVYYLLLSHNFNKDNIEIFESLKLNYTIKINYYIIPPRFSRLKRWTSFTDCIYYKLLLPLLLPHVKRIIFLDGDTLIYKDLSEMYNLDFNGSYVLGYPFHNPQMLDKWGIKVIKYINVGVMLINMEKIINENKDIELLQFSVKNNGKLYFPEQDAINVFFYPDTGLLPLKYGIYLFGNLTIFQKVVKKSLRVKINETELSEAIDDPSIVHFSCCYPKIWSKSTKNCMADTRICERFHKDFYFYANKTNYYSKIHKLYLK